MEIIFLGTSSGTPTKTRSVSAVALKKTNTKSWYLIDCGEGTQHQLLKTKLSLRSLKAIFITHVHGDHCFGLPGLVASATLAGRTTPLHIIGPQELQQWVEYTCEMSQTRLSYELRFIAIEDLSPMSLESFDIDITQLSHRVPSYAYGFTENDNEQTLDTSKLKADGIAAGPIWGKLQNKQSATLESGKTLHYEDYLLPAPNPRKVIISGDNDQPQLLQQCAEHADVLVHEATYTQAISDKVGKTPQHSSAKIVAEFAEEAGIQNLLLTHFSARYQDIEHNATGTSITEIDEEAKQYYSGNLFLAHDFDIFCLDRDRQLTKSN